MRAIPTALAAHLAQPLTTLASCLKIERTDGVVLGFTDCDVDLQVGGITYRASEGFSPTRISSSVNLAVDHLEIDGALSDAAITETDLLAGKYDTAKITLMLVNHQAPCDGILILKYGVVGNVTVCGQQFSLELRGLTQALQQPVGESFSPTCRAEFGDARCGKNITTYSVTGTIDGMDGWQTVLDAARAENDGRYAFGVLTFTSGILDGQQFRVREHEVGKLQLLLPLPRLPQAGDSYSLSQGCDKRFATCASRFANAINFRGEPHLPGLDRILETPTTRSRLE